MKLGIYVGSRAGATCAGPADPLRIGPLVDELSGGHPFVIREYVRWCGGNTVLEHEIDASHDLDHLTMPDDWYVTGGRELDLVLSYLPPVADLDGWLAFIDRALDRYGHLVRYLQVTHRGHNIIAGGCLALLSLFGMVMLHEFLDQFEEGTAYASAIDSRDRLGVGENLGSKCVLTQSAG